MRPVLNAAVFALWLQATSCAEDAEGLLRGVELARTRCKSLRVEFHLEHMTPETQGVRRYVAELANDRRRFESFATERDRERVIVVRESEVQSYRDSAAQDLVIYDLHYALYTAGDVAFDPRILGLTDSLSVAVSVRDCLAYGKASALSLVGEENFRGARLWRVRVKTGGSEADFWIEQPTFRVHKVTETFETGLIEIVSEYDDRDVSNPLPIRVVATRRDQTGATQRKQRITVDKWELCVQIPPERFERRTLGLPLNTPVVNRLTMKREGYWDGMGLSEYPVAVERQPGGVQVTSSFWRLTLLVALVLCAGGIGVTMLIRRRKRSR